MTKARSSWLVAGFVVLVGLPLMCHWARISPGERCALDGIDIEPLYRVRIVEDNGQVREFCCIRCAENWLARKHAVSVRSTARSVWVTDEVSGTELDAAKAVFVRSQVVTNHSTGNRIHAFRSRDDAVRHAEYHNGTVLAGGDRPFSAKKANN